MNKPKLREKALTQGVSDFTDEELIQVLFSTGSRTSRVSSNRPAIEVLSRDLMDRFSNLAALFSAPPEVWFQTPGIGPSRVAVLLAIGELCRRMMTTGLVSDLGRVLSSAEAYPYFRKWAAQEQETLSALFLNARGNVLCVQEIFRGRLESAEARPREILRAALKANAARFLIAHNHPSGHLSPSPEDFQFTRKLQEISLNLGIPLVDHLILSHTGYYSFANRQIYPARATSGVALE